MNTTNAPYANVDQGGPWDGGANPEGNTQHEGNNSGNWDNNATSNNTGGDWQNEGNGGNPPDQGGGWNDNNNSEVPQDNTGDDWNGGGDDGKENSNNNAGDSGWGDNNNFNTANGGDDAWASSGNVGNNDNSGGGVNDKGWAADNTDLPITGNDWGGGADGGQVEAASPATAGTFDIARELYGPHGPYYSLRALRPDEPRPDAEEEPRYDVPQSLAARRGSTKQVQPGPGYRYFKKRVIPDYIDTMETPYARFVFKYRTKGKSSHLHILWAYH